MMNWRLIYGKNQLAASPSIYTPGMRVSSYTARSPSLPCILQTGKDTEIEMESEMLIARILPHFPNKIKLENFYSHKRGQKVESNGGRRPWKMIKVVLAWTRRHRRLALASVYVEISAIMTGAQQTGCKPLRTFLYSTSIGIKCVKCTLYSLHLCFV
ncbi:hypothetical protein KQX54_007446 [Cotesia glomerata]|uniref:Uncharacterized protein n=1 Tax=Cotesia glomerata TaxID=32391 RepID=A0AAV7HQ61_COTGL|nr:hypothetical protein KQX54_007446 [Cotesia glomerata]